MAYTKLRKLLLPEIREEGKAIVLIGKQNNSIQLTEEEIENSYAKVVGVCDLSVDQREENLLFNELIWQTFVNY